jgi:hypothetical protein
VRGRSSGVDVEAVAGIEGAGAPVSGGAGLQLKRRRGRWLRCGVEAERGKSWCRGENLAGGGGSVLKGSGGEGGWRGGRHMEAEQERERGALGAARTVLRARQ